MNTHARDQTVPLIDRPAARRFTLKDAMTLIAAAAVGLTFIRYSLSGCFTWEAPAQPGKIVYNTCYNTGKLLYGIVPILFALCATVVVAGLRGPRPRGQEFAVRPGLGACAAALVAFAVAAFLRLLGYAVIWMTRPIEVFGAKAPELWSPEGIAALFRYAGEGAMPAVLTVWGLQRLSGMWQPIAEWPDRLGRALGWIFLLWLLTPH
jgi:hypothetical protein